MKINMALGFPLPIRNAGMVSYRPFPHWEAVLTEGFEFRRAPDSLIDFSSCPAHVGRLSRRASPAKGSGRFRSDPFFALADGLALVLGGVEFVAAADDRGDIARPARVGLDFLANSTDQYVDQPLGRRIGIVANRIE